MDQTFSWKVVRNRLELPLRFDKGRLPHISKNCWITWERPLGYMQPTWSDQRSLKMFTNFMFFIRHWYYNIYEVNIFVELADKEASGCRRVVSISWRKESYFEVVPAPPLGLIGLWERSKSFWWSGTLITNIWCAIKIVRSVLTSVYYQGIFLDVKVDNLV